MAQIDERISDIPDDTWIWLHSLDGLDEHKYGDFSHLYLWFNENREMLFSADIVQEMLTPDVDYDNHLSNIFTAAIQLGSSHEFKYFWDRLTDASKRDMLSGLYYHDISNTGAHGNLLTMALLKGDQEMAGFIISEGYRLCASYDLLNMLYCYRFTQGQEVLYEVEIPLLTWLICCSKAHEGDERQKYVNAALQLIELGADIDLAATDVNDANVEDGDLLEILDDTPFMVAAKYQQIEILNAIIARNPELTLQGNHGFTLRHIFQIWILDNNPINLIIPICANKDEEGRTALEITEDVVNVAGNIYSSSLDLWKMPFYGDNE